MNSNTRTFLKWPGGKRWLTPEIGKIFSQRGFTNYYEPFLGGGSIYFYLAPKRAVISDNNSWLINSYKAVRDSHEKVTTILGSYRNDKELFYELRSAESNDSEVLAANLIFLMNTCWGGLYRVNNNGLYNVPYGNNSRSYFDPNNLKRCSSILQKSEILCEDFRSVLMRVAGSDAVYIDPPYCSKITNGVFNRYGPERFTWQDQIELSIMLTDLRLKGATIVISMIDTEEIREVYRNWNISKYSRKNTLPQNKNYQERKEILITS